jgi:hypothetical protein
MKTALILCGALAREVIAIAQQRDWDVDLFGIDANFHVHVDKIAPAVEKRILALRDSYERLIVVYGDCGTGGELDRVLTRYGVERLRGAHCFQWYGSDGLMAEEPGTFFLTDFMVRTFRGMIIKGMGLDRFPELRQMYFENYKRIVYLVQKPEPQLVEQAKAAAHFLGLPLEVRATGFADLETQLAEMLEAH